MALRAARRLFRLWVILAVLWFAVVAFIAWEKFEDINYEETRRATWDMSDPFADLHVSDAFVSFSKRCPSHLWYPDRIEQNCLKPSPEELAEAKANAEQRQSAIWQLSLLAFLPPAFVLTLGSASLWAFRDFR
jgi:hypothetical protein